MAASELGRHPAGDDRGRTRNLCLAGMVDGYGNRTCCVDLPTEGAACGRRSGQVQSRGGRRMLSRTTTVERYARALSRVRRHTLVAAMALAAGCTALFGAAPAQAGLQKEFQVFDDCPLANPAVTVCIYSTTTSGEFHIGSKTVPINKTVVLQGGLKGEEEELIPAADGNTLSKTPLVLPGGLVGLEVLPPLTEVTATSELAGTVLVNTANFGKETGAAVTMPMKVKL